MSEQEKAQAVARAARLLARDDLASRQALGSLWDEAFDKGRLAALDELQDRFCVCRNSSLLLRPSARTAA